MKAIDFAEATTAQLIEIHNSVAEKAVKGFASKADGAEKVNALLEEHTKGKEKKAKLALGVSGLTIGSLVLIAGSIPLAKDLTAKVFPAHQRLLSVLQDSAGLNVVHKDLLAKSLGVKADDAKYADALGAVYALNLMSWDEQGNVGLLDYGINYLKANKDSFDKTTPFSDLQSEKIKKVKEKSDGGGKRMPKSYVIHYLLGDQNPCVATSTRHADYVKIIENPGMTIEQFLEKGGVAFNLLDAVKRARVQLKSPDGTITWETDLYDYATPEGIAAKAAKEKEKAEAKALADAEKAKKDAEKAAKEKEKPTPETPAPTTPASPPAKKAAGKK